MRPPRVRVRVRRPRMRVHRRLSDFSVNRMVPNVLTLLAVCAGMTAIRFAVNGKFEAACYAIIVAGIFDGLDGRIARLLRSTSRFGAELDSLSDFISFGVAPAVVLYLWTMSALQSIGWAIVLIFAVCCALWLARFNSQLAHEPRHSSCGFITRAPAAAPKRPRRRPPSRWPCPRCPPRRSTAIRPPTNRRIDPDWGSFTPLHCRTADACARARAR